MKDLKKKLTDLERELTSKNETHEVPCLAANLYCIPVGPLAGLYSGSCLMGGKSAYFEMKGWRSKTESSFSYQNIF